MTNPSEFEAGRWIKATLEAAGSPPAYLDVVPGDQAPPAVRFDCRSRLDVRTNGQHIAIARWRFLVVGMTLSHDVAGAAALAALIDDALHGAAGSTDKLQVIACTRVGTWSHTAAEQGDLYRLGGALYEIIGAAA